MEPAESYMGIAVKGTRWSLAAYDGRRRGDPLGEKPGSAQTPAGFRAGGIRPTVLYNVNAGT